jgi:hypothetical protein
MKTLTIGAAIASMLAFTGAVQASLVSLGDGTVMDTASNLIWLQDWNVNGAQDRATQDAWAQNLAFAGSSDWVLPSMLDFVTLFAGVGDLTNPSLPFIHVQGIYWSSIEVVPGGLAESFGPARGLLGLSFESFAIAAVAVHPGAAPNSIPEPRTLALVALVALGAATVARRRRPTWSQGAAKPR